LLQLCIWNGDESISGCGVLFLMSPCLHVSPYWYVHSYTQIQSSGSLLKEEAVDSENKVEMVTVPALGPEWGKDEMHQLTKAGKNERKNESRAQFWKSWNRGERGLCGPYFTRKVFIFFVFGLCCAIAIVLGFTIPRVPSFSLLVANPLVNATRPFATAVPTIFSRSPTNFSFPAFASLQFDTTNNFLPVHFTQLSASVYDLDSNLQVGSGSYARGSFPAQSFPAILLPINFTYITSNTSDQTWLNWYNACRNAQFYPGSTRPSLKFRLVLEMNILGLPGQHGSTSQTSDASCPVELPVNAPWATTSTRTLVFEPHFCLWHYPTHVALFLKLDISALVFRLFNFV